MSSHSEWWYREPLGQSGSLCPSTYKGQAKTHTHTHTVQDSVAILAQVMASTVLSPQPGRRKRTLGVDLPDDVASALFGEHVLVSHCSAKTLWKLERKKVWECCTTNRKILASIVQATGGRIPRQASFGRQFACFCKDASLQWSAGDIELRIWDLRRMLAMLLKRVRQGQASPRKHKDLGEIMDLLVRDGDSDGMSTDDCLLDDEELFSNTPMEGEVDLSEHEAELIHLSDDDSVHCCNDEVEADLEKLEIALFEQIKKRRRMCTKTIDPSWRPGAMGSKAMTDTEIDDLYADACAVESVVPLPRDYRAKFQVKKTCRCHEETGCSSQGSCSSSSGSRSISRCCANSSGSRSISRCCCTCMSSCLHH